VVTSAAAWDPWRRLTGCVAVLTVVSLFSAATLDAGGLGKASADVVALGRSLAGAMHASVPGDHDGAAPSGGLPGVAPETWNGLRPWQPGGAPAPAVPPPVLHEGCTVSSLLVPSCGVWTGVAPGAFEDRPKPEALAEFEDAVGEPVDIVHVYHAAGDRFPTEAEVAMTRQGGSRRMLMINYKPQGQHSWAEVAEGAVDGELERQAAYLRDHFTDPFFLTVHHEPEDDVVPSAGSGYAAEDYARMYRHVIEHLRGEGVSNLVAVLNLMGSPEWAVQPWFEQLYPGDDVVDWIGWDPYACSNPDKPCGDFAGMVNRTTSTDWPGFYAWARRTHSEKPLMLAEWGVFDNGPPERKAEFLATVADQLPDFPAIKALLYFDSSRAPRGDTRVDSSRAALTVFRELAADPHFRQSVP
jgi:hypothetical protein